MKNANLTAWLMALSAALVTGCGGGGTVAGLDGTLDDNPKIAAVASGTLTKGSVIVNGIRFTAADNATIMVDDNPGQTEDALRNGMEVKVKGLITDDAKNGKFEKVEVEPEVRGVIAAKGVDDLQVNGQPVIVDDTTIFEDKVAGVFSPLTFANLAVADHVEIHGGRDDLGRIRASRVERHDDNLIDEVKGTISTAPNGTTFQISSMGLGTVTVNYSSATLVLPAGSTLNLGDPVEVHGPFNAGVITATRIDREDLEDADFKAANGLKVHAQGFVSGFTAHPGTFTVNGMSVQTTSATVFLNGFPIDMGNGLLVEAEGPVTQGVLQAVKIKFKRAMVRVQATATAHSGTSVTLFGKTITVNPSLTRLDNFDLNTIVDGTTRVEVRGFVDGSGNIIPTRIDPAGGGNDFFQAPVSAKDAVAKSLVLLSGSEAINANLANVLETNFKNMNNLAIGSAAFFAAVTPAASGVPGTVVKVKGSFDANTITATEAEIEK